MSQEDEYDDSNNSDSDNETKAKSKGLVKYSKKNIFLYDKKCRTVLHLGVLYKNLTKAAANSINLDKVTSKIQKMIDKNQIYLRDVGPIILGITKIVVKKTYILLDDIEELTKLRINSRDENRLTKKEIKDYIEDKDNSSKKNKLNAKDEQIVGNEIKESVGTNPLNINSLDNDIFNYQNTHLLSLENSIKKNKKANNKYSDLTFRKDIIELNNDDMIRRTIQKMSRLNDSDIKNIVSTNKKSNKKEIKFDSDNKNSKTLQNLREMLLNKNNNTNVNDPSHIMNSENIIDDNNTDNNNKDVDGFFTVIKSQIEDQNNDNRIDELNNNDGNNDINFDFQINVNSLQDKNFNSNIKYKIKDDDPVKSNLKSNKKKKTLLMLKGRLKYDEDLEMEMEESTEKLSDKQKREFEKRIEKENQQKLENLQLNYNIFHFDRNKLTTFNEEKYEYLLPKFLETEDTDTYNREDESEIKGIRKEESIEGSSTKLNIINNSNLESNDKNDISRLNRLTTSNKKKLTLGNFDSDNKLLMQNLSRMTLDKNDFKGSISFIEKIKEIDKENKKNKDSDIKREDNSENINSNFNDLDIIEQDVNNDNNNDINIDIDNNENNKGNNIKYIDDIKEEEDIIQLKEDLETNVFKNKKNISFVKIRDKLDNKEKFMEPKLFYDMLLLAQKGDIEMTQKKIMDNESINIHLNE